MAACGQMVSACVECAVDKIRYLYWYIVGCAGASVGLRRIVPADSQAIDRTPPLKYSKHAQIKLVFLFLLLLHKNIVN